VVKAGVSLFKAARRTGKLTYGDYFRGSARLHAIGILGGAIWMLAPSFKRRHSGRAYASMGIATDTLGPWRIHA